MPAPTRHCRLLTTILNNSNYRTTCRTVLNTSNYVEVSRHMFFQSRTICTNSLLYSKHSFELSDIGEGIREVAVKEWFVKVGDKVAQFDNICEVQSDKASVTITSRYDGVITKLYYKIDETALVGKPLVDIETDDISQDAASSSDSSDDEKPEPATISQPIITNPSSYKKDICIPSVRRLAKENKVDLTKIQGTGKDFRILKEDVLKYLDSTNTSQKPSKIQVGDRVEPITGFRKAMVKTMTESLNIPHFVYSDEIAVTKLSQIRQAMKEESLKLSFMPFFIKAASNGLLQYPVLNSTLDGNCENITYKGAHNIGIAMATKAGLAVPVIKNVEQLSIMEISKELNRLMLSGKQGNFSANDLTGGTFTISNIGIVGGTYTQPVILPPQVAIIAIGGSKVVPRFDAALNVVPEEIVCLSGSADHRVVDGVAMANFVNVLKKQIENPYLLFLNQ